MDKTQRSKKEAPSGFSIDTDAFEGPLELLLELVQKRKVYINDISLADVADEFVSIVSEERDLFEEAVFIQVAATLLLIKSRSLLPGIRLTDEETEAIDGLERAFSYFETIRAIANDVRDSYGREVYCERARVPAPPVVFAPDENITEESMHKSAGRVIEYLPPRTLPERVSIAPTVRLEDVLDALRTRFRANTNMQFSELVKDSKDRRSVTVHFIALLELVRRGVLEAAQEGGEVRIMTARAEVDVPRYT